ncbi:YidC/Oxa1 family membrane protein insertase [Marinactinospora endophytica]
MYSIPPIAAAIGFAAILLTTLTGVLTPVFGAAAAGAAVICLTIFVRLLVLPLGYLQVRAEKTRERLAPKVRALQARHGSDPERLSTEMMRLYTEEKTSPLAGCLPMLAQTPVFIVLYGLFIVPEVGGRPNELLARTFGGVPLGALPGEVLAAGGSGLWVFGVVALVIAAGAWASRQWLTLPAMRRAEQSGQEQLPGMSVMTYLPFITVVVTMFVPLAAGLYLAATTVWTVAERLVLRRLVRV